LETYCPDEKVTPPDLLHFPKIVMIKGQYARKGILKETKGGEGVITRRQNYFSLG
jgi:hypothetical protein